MAPPDHSSGWPLGEGGMACRIRAADWASTPLGSPATWPDRLRAAVELVLDLSCPACLAWGPDLLLLPNDGAVALPGLQAPDVLGRPLTGIWPEAAGAGAGLVPPTGTPFDWTPLRDSAGEVAGFLGLAPARHQAGTGGIKDGGAPQPVAADDPAFILDAFGAADYDADLRTGAVRPSPRLNALYGRPADHPLSVADCMAAVDPDDAGQLSAIVQGAQDGRAQFQSEFRIDRPDGTLRWVLSRGEVLLDAMGRPERVRGAAIDVTDRRTVEENLRASEERLAAIFANAPVGLSEIAPDGRFLQANDELCRILGRPRDEVLSLGVPDVTHPDDIGPSLQAVSQARGSGRSAAFDKRYLRPDRSVVWASSRVSLLRHGDSRPDSLLAVTVDLTDRRAAEEALRDSEARLRLAVEVGSLATWDWDLRTGRVAWSDEHYRINGYNVGEVEPSFEAWAARVHPEDLPATIERIGQARAGRHDYTHEFRSLHPDGSIRWCTARGRFFYDDRGAPLRMVGVMLDVTERRSWEDRLAVLVAELQHRTRNLMGVVRSVADRTLAGTQSLEDFQDRFRDRLGALSRVSGLLSRLREGDRITFDELLRTELMGHGISEDDPAGPGLVLRGPEGIRLRSSSVQTFALALHELTTNALKHGALSWPRGRLEVSWTPLEGPGGERLLRVEWRESGRPPAGRDDPEPPARGYGRELIERALPYQLGAETSYELGPEGVRCTITLPISSGPGSI